MDYVNLLPLVNKVSIPEGIKVKFLRLCLSEHRQASFDKKRLDEDDAPMHFDRIWGTGDNISSTDT